jgi:hypothetical protein
MSPPKGEFSFTHPQLTPLNPDLPPNAQSVRLLIRELYANARRVPSKLGGGKHGHLGMLMPKAAYIKIAPGGTEFIPPTLPTQPTYKGDATDRATQRDEYKEAVDIFHEYVRLEAALQQQILQAVPPVYLSELADPILGFAEVTPVQMVTHLQSQYGTITPDDLAANLVKIKTPWNPDTPLETVFVLGTECRDFAKAGEDPISDPTYLRILLDIFRASGVMATALEEWDSKAKDQKTVANARVHFTQKDKYRRQSKEYLQECLASGPSSALPAVRHRPPPPPTTPSTHTRTLEGYQYCWSHGICTHSGTDCRAPQPGHIPTATLSSNRGGSLRVRLSGPDRITRLAHVPPRPPNERRPKRQRTGPPTAHTPQPTQQT